MKKVIIYITALILFSLTIAGCSKSPAEDFYVERTDFQYQYYDEFHRSIMARGNDAMYFTIGYYIYRLDEETQILAPLCNKPNCLHEKETDNNRVPECNAYISMDENKSEITYMNEYIYTIMQDWKEGELCYGLYKIAEDGSTKERVYQWDGTVVEGWCLHRNVLYYVEHTYDENNQEFYAVKEMKLSGIGKLAPKTVWEPDEDITVFAFGIFKAYGNHLYFNMDGVKTNNVDELTSEEDWIKYSYNKTFQYNLQNKTLSEIQVPNQEATQRVSSVTFWKNQIVYDAFDLTKNRQYDATTDVYIADLDGTNAMVLMKDMPIYRNYYSDGTYLFVSNAPECADKIIQSPEYQNNIAALENRKWDYKVNVDVYDENMEFVDSVEPPFRGILPYEPVYGIGDRVYVQIEEDSGEKISIQYWDKTKLGTYNGSKYELIKVCELTRPEGD